MTRLRREEEDDSVEIISIGSLYTGLWHKKYWSSSRGKDRYPYPVGYKALRAYRGSTYKLEIEEGPRGPLFLITDADGRSSSGPTPDIALDKFQKVGCPSLKILNQKRFSCQMEGAEFFGFKMPMIQRLLRELVMNANGRAEVGISSSDSCVGASTGERDTFHEHSHTNPKTETTLAESPAGSKRNREIEITYVRVRRGLSKRARPRILLSGADALNATCTTLTPHNVEAVPTTASEVENGPDGDKRASLSRRHLDFAGEDHSFSSENSVQLNGINLSKFCSESAVPAREDEELAASRSCESVALLKTLSEEFGRLSDTADGGSRLTSEGRAGHDGVPEGDWDTNKLVPFSFDSLEVLQDDKRTFTLSVGCDEDTQYVKEKLIAAATVIPQEVAAESHPEDAEASNENVSSQKSDNDSANQDIAKSMITVLLPQAIPLMKGKTSRKKETAFNPLETESSRLTYPEKIIDKSRFVDVKSGVWCEKTCTKHEVNMQYQSLDADAIIPGHPKPITPDSVDENQPANHVKNQGPSISIDEPRESKDIYSYDDFRMNKKLQDDDAKKPESGMGCIHPSQKVSPEEVQDTLADLTRNPLQIGNHCLGKDLEIAPDLFEGLAVSQNMRTNSCNNMTDSSEDVLSVPGIKSHRDLNLNAKPVANLELLGCYFHPQPVLSALVNHTNNEIHICVLCGSAFHNTQTLFIYKVAPEGPLKGQPFTLGHASIMLPCANDNFERESPTDSSSIQFSSNGEYLILVDAIKTPYCREGRIDCPCSNCKSKCYEKNAVKLVQIKHGYVSVVKKLKMIGSVTCILVCYPNNLIAVGECGRLHIWIMNLMWSAPDEEYIIPVTQSISPCIVELRRIPKSSHLVIGHNRSGEFVVWDITRKIMVSRFSTEGISISQFSPVGLFSWRPIFDQSFMEGHIDGILAATKSWFSRDRDNNFCLPQGGEEIAFWLIVLMDSDPNVECKLASSRAEYPIRCWRLALLVKNEVIVGSTLDPRASVVGTSSGGGIIGTHDGHVYIWDLTTGTKLGTLHDFKGGSVSCITVDDSRQDTICIASGDGQLLLYLRSERQAYM